MDRRVLLCALEFNWQSQPRFISHQMWDDTLPKRIARINQRYANREQDIPRAQCRRLQRTSTNPSIEVHELSIISFQLFITLLRFTCGLEGELLLERERTIAVR